MSWNGPQPSLGEFQFLQELRVREIAAQAVVAAQAAAAAATSQMVATTSGVMPVSTYDETEIDIGTVMESTSIGLPGRYGAALSLIASVRWDSIEASQRPEAAGESSRRTRTHSGFVWMHWWLEDSLDGENWWGLSAPGDNGVRVCPAGDAGFNCGRFTLPFADRLRVPFEFRDTNRVGASPSSGIAHGLSVVVGVTRTN